MQQAGCAALFYLFVPVENGLSHVSVHRLLPIIASQLEEYDRRNSGNIRSKAGAAGVGARFTQQLVFLLTDAEHV